MVVSGGGGGGGVETQSPPNGFACLGGRNTWKLVTWKTLLLHQRWPEVLWRSTKKKSAAYPYPV